LKLGVVKRSNSLYSSPIFWIPKKQTLNQNAHIDKYSMKEITECIGNIGRADYTIFTTLDLTSGFWQMQLDEDSQKPRQGPIPLDPLANSIGSRHPWDYYGVRPASNNSWKGYSVTSRMYWFTSTTYWYTRTPMRSTWRSWTRI
jgi:hypothetical protein